MKKIYLTISLCVLIFAEILHSQETVVVQTLTYDSTGRNYMFDFPDDDGTTYESIIMEYSMRCKGANISVPGNTNFGCGEWDYSCNTFIIDSSYVDSLKATHPSHLISGFSEDQFPYVSTPTITRTLFEQKNVEYTNVASEQNYTLGEGTALLNHPFMGDLGKTRVQYIWTKEELDAAGMSAGAIDGLKFIGLEGISNASFLKIRIKSTENLEFGTFSLSNLQEVYFRDTEIRQDENHFKFHTPFDWDGGSHLVIDISYNNEAALESTKVNGVTTASTMGMMSSGASSHFFANGAEALDIDESGFEAISDEITISLWNYGSSSALPSNTTVFRGNDPQGNRNANAHIPWSNSQIFWDCGYANGGYDRINKTANPEDFEGKWNHWAFTKNAVTGEMKIYLNGNLWHSGSNMTRPIRITDFSIANNYFGSIDEFQVWSKELSAEEIKSWMHRSVTENHPKYDALVAYYKFDEGTGSTIYNSVDASLSAELPNNTSWRAERADRAFTNFEALQAKPNVIFVSGEYETSVEIIDIIKEEENTPNIVEEYVVNGTDLELESTQNLWLAIEEYLLDDEGEILEVYPLDPEGIINVSTLDYYRKLPSQFEIMSFVTPYGIYLDLGEEGRTWTFDVTDFAPILTGRKRMYLGMGGQNQEEMDIKFIYKKGTPPRDVRSIHQIWRSGTSRNFTQIMEDRFFEPVDIKLDDDASYFKIRSSITGHGQEGEFIPRMHQLTVDELPLFSWNVWTECADNPVYPQGGTWIYDRAGWCPGAPTDLQEWNLSEYAVPGSTISLDYNVTSGSGDSRYIVNHQLVTYGEANFQNDARIERILNPTNDVEFARSNPICDDPVVVLTNSGENTLSTAQIKYNVEGGEVLTFNWEGDLDFMESEEVQLPIEGLEFWVGNGSNTFIAEVVSANGSPDEYQQNNKLTTQFDMPDMFDEDKIIIFLSTNNFGNQSSYSVKDGMGNTVFSRGNCDNNTLYADTLALSNGCYTIELSDAGQNGLSFWAEPNQGNGNFLIRSETAQLKSFDPDFGSILRYSFIKGEITNVSEVDRISDFDLYPNPAKGQVNVMLDLDIQQDVSIVISDVAGRTILKNEYSHRAGLLNMDVSAFQNGIYYVTVIGRDFKATKKLIVVN